MKKLCPAVRNIIQRLRVKDESMMPNAKIFEIHVSVYHLPTTQYGEAAEFCKVFNIIVDVVSWEEVVEIANAAEGV